MSPKPNSLKAVVYEMSLLFNQQPSEERINAYANHLSRFTAEQVIFAFKKEVERGSAFFPSLAELLSHLRPVEISSDDQAAAIADEIMQAIIHGKSFESLTVLAQKTIGSSSTMRILGNADQSQIPTNKAQLRMKARSIIERQRMEKREDELAALGVIKTANLSEPKQGRYIDKDQDPKVSHTNSRALNSGFKILDMNQYLNSKGDA